MTSFSLVYFQLLFVLGNHIHILFKFFLQSGLSELIMLILSLKFFQLFLYFSGFFFLLLDQNLLSFHQTQKSVLYLMLAAYHISILVKLATEIWSWFVAYQFLVDKIRIWGFWNECNHVWLKVLNLFVGVIRIVVLLLRCRWS